MTSVSVGFPRSFWKACVLMFFLPECSARLRGAPPNLGAACWGKGGHCAIPCRTAWSGLRETRTLSRFSLRDPVGADPTTGAEPPPHPVSSPSPSSRCCSPASVPCAAPLSMCACAPCMGGARSLLGAGTWGLPGPHRATGQHEGQLGVSSSARLDLRSSGAALASASPA